MALKHKIIYNTAVQFVGRFLTSFIGFLTTIILARYLGAADYGVYAKIFTLASFFYLFVDFGLNAVYIRRFQNNLKSLSQVFVLRAFLSLVSVVIILLFFGLSGASVFSSQEKLWAIILLPTILLFGFYTTFNIIFQLKLRYDLSVLSSIIGGLAGLLLLIGFLSYGIVMALIALVVGYLVTILCAYFFSRRLSAISFSFPLKFPFKLKTGLLKDALPLGTMLFLNTMYSRIDVFVISAYVNNQAVGVYQLAYKFFEFPLSFALFFSNSVFPHYIKTYRQDVAYFWQIFKKSTFYLLLSSVVFVIGGYLLAGYLNLIKPEYVASSAPLRILVLSYPVFFATSALSWLIFVLKKEKYLILVYGVSFVVNILANILLVPKYSFIASSWITVIGEMLVLAMLIGVLSLKKQPAKK